MEPESWTNIVQEVIFPASKSRCRVQDGQKVLRIYSEELAPYSRIINAALALVAAVVLLAFFWQQHRLSLVGSENAQMAQEHNALKLQISDLEARNKTQELVLIELGDSLKMPRAESSARRADGDGH